MTDRDDKRDPGGSSGGDVDPDAPPSPEEIAASRQLRDAIDGSASRSEANQAEAIELVQALRAAWAPLPLDETEHAELVEDLPDPEELALAAELRDALEGRDSRSSAGTTEMAVALRSAWNPRALDAAAHRAVVDRALGLDASNVVSIHAAQRSRSRVPRVIVVTATSVLAFAASVIVWITTSPSGGGEEAPLAHVRSTQPLFDEPFRAGEASARIDKIALARASDYRDNRFAKWGVR